MRPYQYVTSPADLPKIAEEVLHTDAVALDLETAKIGGGGSTDPLTGRIRLCSLNTGKGRYVIDLYRTGDLGPVAKALSETNAVIVGQNLKFDQKWLLWHYGIELKRVFDTFRASHVLYAGVPRLAHDLWSLYKRELNEDPGVEDLAASDWDGPLDPKQLDYAADDVDKLLRLREVLRPKLLKENLARIAQIEFQAILPEAAIELNGFYLDAQRWTKRTKMDEARARALAALLHAELPSPHAQLTLPGLRAAEEFSFNLDSPDQVLQSLRQLGVKQKVKDLETGVSSIVPLVDTKEMTLAMLTGKWPILAKFIDYRGYSKNATAFGTEYLQHIHPTSKRIHCSYFPYTDAGRYACVAPWTPVRTRLGEKPIISVQVGDEVWTHKERWQKVTAFLPQGTQPTYAVKFSNGEVLTCTASHRILLADGSWKTVGEIHSEHIENVGAEPDEPAGGSEAISESGGSTAGGHSAETRDIISQRSGRCEAVLARSRAQSPSSPTLLSLERGDEEPHVREERGSASQLEGSLRGRSRLSDVPMEREAPLRSSGRDAGSAGTEVASGRDRCPPHRWGSEKQLLGQSCPSHGTRTPRYSLFAGEGQPLVGVEEIHPAGSIEVYDLTVAEDESYQTYGIFSHNCRSPNLQQIPRGKDFRECFRAEDGRQLAICDWSNIEMRLIAETSGDKRLIRVFTDNKDAHYVTAALMTGKNEKDITKDERQQAKPVNFGFCIAEGQRVLTKQDGLVPIEDIQDQHLVWDGVEWVSHDGLVFMGEREVITHDGLTATPDHTVYTETGKRVRFADAASSLRHGRLAIGATGKDPVRYTAFDEQAGTTLVAGERVGIGIRPDRQQRTLFTPQSAPYDLLGKPLQQGVRRARTYDLINAGPRHRFTVEGRVVSNCYGMSADKLVLYAKSSYGVTLSLSEAKRFRRAFFEGYDGIAAWHRFALDSGKRRGETRTLWGRRRIVKDQKAHNEFYNSPIQGSGADGLKNSLRVVYEKLRKINGDRSPLLAKGALASMVHMVHDEIIVEHVEEPELTKAAQAALHAGMIEGMAPMMGKVPTVAEVGGGPDWSAK